MYIIDQNKKNISPESKQGYVGIAQINTSSGDIEHNAEKIVKNIINAQDSDLDLVIFPQSGLIGNLPKETLKRFPVIAENNLQWLEEIAKITTKTTALVGFAEKTQHGEYNNTLAILSQGKVIELIRNENKDFKTFQINGIKYGILADIKTISKEKCQIDNPDVIICFSPDPTIAGETQLKQDYLANIAKEFNSSVIFVNQVGATDNLSFHGASAVYDKNGELIARAKSFEEQFIAVNPIKCIGEIYPLAKGLDLTVEKSFSLDYEQDMERTYKTVIQGIKDYFSKTGFKRAVLGLSGGLDSTVCAVLLVDALGKENIFGISMPSKITSLESKSDAQQLAQNLGINFAIAPIKDMVDTTDISFQTLFENIEGSWNCRYKQSFTMDNIQARSRAMYLWGVSNEFESCLPIATSDKSEAYMGYATINGDMSGGFAPIGDITKTKLFALARWLNKNRTQKNAIPQSIINKRPGAELAIDPKTGKPLIAEDALMPYEFLDEIIWRTENKQEQFEDMLNSEFIYEKEHNISHEQKTEWLNKFYRRMSSALYKKTILPPYVIVDSPLCDYKQPITSCHIDYKKLTPEDIQNKISKFI